MRRQQKAAQLIGKSQYGCSGELQLYSFVRASATEAASCGETAVSKRRRLQQRSFLYYSSECTDMRLLHGHSNALALFVSVNHVGRTSRQPTRCHLSTHYILSRHGFTSSSLSLSTTLFRQKQLLPKFKSSSSLLKRRLTPPPRSFSNTTLRRHASTSSNQRWQQRQKSDRFAKEAKVQNLKSRAAFKLLQINDRYHIFRPGQTVVDLGFAPGSWSQVAIDMVRPGLGRVVGVDIIPVAPPRGVNGLQGNFLSPETQNRVRELLKDESAGRVRRSIIGDEVAQDQAGYIDRERAATSESESEVDDKEYEGRVVDVVLSDMSAPWEITSGLWKNSLSNPYYRMMNTSGNKFKDHAGSIVSVYIADRDCC